jgi:hypothetical protein
MRLHDDPVSIIVTDTVTPVDEDTAKGSRVYVEIVVQNASNKAGIQRQKGV